ncbi:isoaspartyl peptidase/L-asparaginase family protein [Sinomicrobium sp.]
MKHLFVILLSLSLFACGNSNKEDSGKTDDVQDQNTERYVLVIHGGAGTITKEKMTPEREKAYREGLEAALSAGYEQWKSGKTGLDMVEAAIIELENDSLFNAGKGAVLTHEGKNELDASIMWGPDRNAGAVAGVTTIKNPIKAARLVMEKSEHVMLVGKGAEQFAESGKLDIVDPSYFMTDRRSKQLKRILKRDSTKIVLDHDEKHGTVGAVALDKNGNLAAGTSTGGMVNKQFGRIGDSPIIGAGNYAGKQVAVSCTGWGEFYIRNVAAYDVEAQMEYNNASVTEASAEVIRKIGDMGGTGGMIAIDNKGNIAMPFNTRGMYRGAVTEDGKILIEMYK